MDSIATLEASVSRSVMDLERQYLLQNYSRYPLALKRGKGCWLYDTDGKKYLDLIAGIGVNALGHAHPRLTKVIREQAGLMIHCSNLYYHEYQAPLARKLAEVSGLQRSFFSNSGAESMEGAIKMIRSHGRRISGDKFEIVTLENSFHGRTLGALSITGQAKYRQDFEPLLPGAQFVSPGDLNALEQAVSSRTAGIVIEPIQGEGGIHPMPIEYLRRARELADKNDALLVFDEIQCGVGRPGVHFSYQLADPVILPDIMVAAKPLGCGIPMGVIVTNERAASTIAAGMHGSTFGGGPLACRVAIEFMEILDGLLPQIREVGDYFRDGLLELKRKNSFVREVRARGLMLGMELDFPCKQLVLDGIASGLLFNCTHETVLRFLPPYIIGKGEVDRALKALGKLLKNAKRD